MAKTGRIARPGAGRQGAMSDVISTGKAERKDDTGDPWWWQFFWWISFDDDRRG
jgi:hypothetical protein